MFLRTWQFFLVDPSSNEFWRDIGNVPAEPFFPIERGTGHYVTLPFNSAKQSSVSRVRQAANRPDGSLLVLTEPRTDLPAVAGYGTPSSFSDHSKALKYSRWP